MSAVYIPEPLTAPELWYPNRKPLANVKINWNHQLSRRLVCAYLELGKGRFLLDSVKKQLFPIGSNSFLPGGLLDISGDPIAIGGQELIGSNAVTITAEAAPNANSDMAFIGSRLSNDSQDNHLNMRFDRTGVSSGNPYCIKASVKNVSPAAESIGNVWATSEMATYSMSWSEAIRGIEIFRNGVNISDEGGSGAQDSLTLADGQLFIGSGFGSYFNGVFGVVLVHSRKLTDSEIQSLHSNPYQILEAV